MISDERVPACQMSFISVATKPIEQRLDIRNPADVLDISFEVSIRGTPFSTVRKGSLSTRFLPLTNHKKKVIKASDFHLRKNPHNGTTIDSTT